MAADGTETAMGGVQTLFSAPISPGFPGSPAAPTPGSQALDSQAADSPPPGSPTPGSPTPGSPTPDASTTGAQTSPPPPPAGSNGTGAADSSSTSSSASPTCDTNKTGHYWTVELTVPPGAHTGLKSFIALAETEIQTAVDLLGRGATEPPPNVDDLMKPVVYESLGESITADQYEAALDKVETTQTALLTMDEKVMKTAIVVQAANDRTLRSIKTVVKDLNIKLAAVGSAKLKATQEVALMKAIAAAVEDVYEKVTAVADANADMAGDSSDSSDSDSDSSGSSSGSSDSGSGGLGQMLQSLASMVPMLAMAAAPVAQELLTQNKDKDKDQHTEGAQPQDAQAAPPEPPPHRAAPPRHRLPAPPGNQRPPHRRIRMRPDRLRPRRIRPWYRLARTSGDRPQGRRDRLRPVRTPKRSRMSTTRWTSRIRR